MKHHLSPSPARPLQPISHTHKPRYYVNYLGNVTFALCCTPDSRCHIDGGFSTLGAVAREKRSLYLSLSLCVCVVRPLATNNCGDETIVCVFSLYFF